MDEYHDEFQWRTEAELDRQIEITAQVAPWALPILRAARDGRLALFCVGRDVNFPPKQLDSYLCPRLVVLDDDNCASTGPTHFPCAETVFRWANIVIIYGAAGDPLYYQQFAILTEVFRCAVLVECPSKDTEKWNSVVLRYRRPATRIVQIVPFPERVHPSAERRPTEH